MHYVQNSRSEFHQGGHSLHWLTRQSSRRTVAITLLLLLSAVVCANAQSGAPIVGYVANTQDRTVSLLAINTSADFSGPVGPPFFATALNGASPLLIDVGKNSPVRIAATPAGDLVFVTNQGNNTITVIDTTTNQPLAAVIQVKPIGTGPAPQPRGIAVLQQTETILLYVANQGDNSVSVIDVTNIKTAGTSVETARITTKIGPAPIEVALSPDGSHAYVLNNGNGGAGSVTVLDTAVNPPVAVAPSPIAVGNNPTGIAASTDVVYIANRASNSVSVIFTNNFNTPPGTITGVTDPVGVAFIPGLRTALVTNSSASTVTEIIAEQSQGPTPLPPNSHPSQIAISPDGTTAFITDPTGGQVLTLTGLDNVLATGTPARLVVGNGAAGITLVASAPTTPVCGVAVTGTGSSPNGAGVCVPNTKALTMAFQVNAQGGGNSFGCTGAGGGGGTPGSTCGDTGVVGGNEDYSAQEAAAGIYTVIVCTNGGAPPDCGGGPSARQAIAIPALTSPAIICTQPAVATTATPPGLNVQASSSCTDSAAGLNNFTIPATPLQLLMKLDWNDGTTPVTTQGPPVASPGNPISGTHTFGAPGTQTVTVTAIDNILDFSTPVSTSSQVQNAAPVCKPSASIDGFQVNLSPNCTDDDPGLQPVAKIVINWGVTPTQSTTLMNAAVNGSAPFTYPTTTAQTTYNVTVTATDSLGVSSVTPFQVVAPSFVPQGPNCSFSSQPVPNGLSVSAAITCNVTATGDAVSSVTVFWDKTNTVSTTANAPPNTTTYSNTFTHTYSAPGTYNLSVVATDVTGLATASPGTATVTLSVPVAPVCTLTVNGTGGLSVSASGTCTDLDSPIVSVSLNFGDDTVVQGTAGSPNFSLTFAHTYSAAGTYTVTMSATDGAGLSSQLVSQAVTVPSLTVSAPSQTTVSAGGTLTYTVSLPSDFKPQEELTLSCAANPPETALPAGLVCLFSPATIKPGESSTLTIATNALPITGALRMPSLYGLWLSLLPAMLLIGSTVRRRKAGTRRLAALSLAVALVLMLAACGTNLPPAPTTGVVTPAGTYTVLIQVSDAKLNVVGSNAVTITVK